MSDARVGRRLAVETRHNRAHGGVVIDGPLQTLGWGVFSLVTAGALVVILVEADFLGNPAYLALGAAILVGCLITVPWRDNGAPTSLLIIPLVAAQWRFGVAVAPLLVLATIIANTVRGSAWLATLAAAAADLIVFSIASLAALAIPQIGLGTLVFAVVFTVLRVALWTAMTRANVAPTTDRRIDHPDLTLSLLVAPLGAVAVSAGNILGDGGALLALAGLLPMLCVVAEWWRLRVARAEAESERDRLEQARIRQEEMTHLITHEVRNPLTTVLGYCQLARVAVEREQNPPADIGRHLDRIYRGGKTIERLMENLLELSRVEGIGEAERNEEVDLAAIARDVVADIEPLAEQKQLRLLLDVPEHTAIAWGSPMLLKQALSNLVSNAVKYTPEGGTVRVWTGSGPEPGQTTLGVSDTGVGMSEVDRGRLFTRFFRSEDPRVARERGAGLGLALTQAIVQRMGGDIAVDSRLNEGATFRMLLPSGPAEEREA
jgi:signal transduction histidine kinase